MPLSAIVWCQKHSVFELSVHAWSYTRSLLSQYLRNCLWEFHRIYNFGAVGHKGELIRFQGQRSKSQRDYLWSNEHILSPTSEMYVNETYTVVCGSVWHQWPLQGHGFKGHVTDIFLIQLVSSAVIKSSKKMRTSEFSQT